MTGKSIIITHFDDLMRERGATISALAHAAGVSETPIKRLRLGLGTHHSLVPSILTALYTREFTRNNQGNYHKRG